MTPLVRAFLAPLCGLVLAGQAAAQGPDLAARGLAAVALVNNAPTNSIPYATGVNPAAVPIFRKAIANTRAGVSDTIILFEGDSTTAGFLGAAPTSSVGGRAASAPSILATIGVAGLPTQSQSIWADANTGSGWSAYDPRLVFGSGWAANSGLDVLGGHPAGNSTTTAGNLAFTPTIPVDTCVVYPVWNTGQGAWTYQVDSGAVSASQSNSQTAGIGAVTVALGSLGTHTLNIARLSGSVLIAGLECYNSTVKSVRLWNAGRGGALASLLSGATSAWSPGNAVGVSPITPHLTVINLGINDWIYATSISTYTANMQANITAAKRSGDVILVMPYPTNPANTSVAVQQQYYAVIQQLAASNGLTLVDWRGRVVSWATSAANGFGTTLDPFHPVAAGYADWAGAEAQALNALVGR